MLTARDALSDRIEGLNTGADDYVTKPFSFDELLARDNRIEMHVSNLRRKVDVPGAER